MKLLSVLLLGLAVDLAAAKTYVADRAGLPAWRDDYNGTYAATAAERDATVIYSTRYNHGAAVSAEPHCTAQKNSSMVTGGKVILSLLDPYPTLALAVSICCEIASGNYYTNVVLPGPSKKYPDQRDYICTVYAQSGSAAPQIVPGNATTSAGRSVRPPPPDPKCTQKATKAACLGTTPTSAGCAWSGAKCAYAPPLQCGGFGPKKPYGPFCVGVDLAAAPFPSGGAGAALRAFNWTAGTVTPHEQVIVQPVQVLQVGGTTWFSVSVDPAGFKVCVTYNARHDFAELSLD